jgi:putative membrane protein
LALVAGWLTTTHPTLLPTWAPWKFSWTQFLAAALAVIWYTRGVVLMSAVERPALWRQVSFLLGVGSIYAVLLTHFEYMAQHMFFLNRLQSAVLHHFGPFLIALSWPGAALLRGMPAPLRGLCQSRAAARAIHAVQQPVLAGVLFIGLIGLWLIPPVHFQAMINPRLYDVMNWSMTLDGVLFWCLVLDPRLSPPARISFGTRLAVAVLVMFPQIAIGAKLTFSGNSFYSYYDLCGRLLPSMGALQDQHLGGIIVWIPSAMMSSLAFLLILNHLRIHEDQVSGAESDADDGQITINSSAWTGR